jgi:hypothetical protein
MLSSALLFQATELLAWLLLFLKLKRDSVRRTLIHGSKRSTTIPIVDEKLKSLSGVPTKSQQKTARLLVKTVRGITNTKAFEYVVLGIVNSKSRLRKSITSTPVSVRIL